MSKEDNPFSFNNFAADDALYSDFGINLTHLASQASHASHQRRHHGAVSRV